jgi:hypothetical protein
MNLTLNPTSTNHSPNPLKTMLNSVRTLSDYIDFGTAWAVTFVICTVGCSGANTNQAVVAPVENVFIARPCAALKEWGLNHSPVGLFIEIANVSSPVESPLRDWLKVHPVKAHHVGGMMLEGDKPTNGPWGICENQSCTSQRDGTVSARVLVLPNDPAAPIDLQLELTIGNDAPMRTIVRTGNQEPAIAAFSAPHAWGTTIVTPYYVFEPKQESLSILLQCKTRHEAVKPTQ